MKNYNYYYLEKLLEKKDHLIKKLTSLTDEQKQQAIDFFNKHPNYENEIDWNRKDLTWEDFDAVINKSRDTKSQIKKAVKKGIEGLQEGEDYIYLGTFKYEGSDVDAYIPLNWKGSRVLASDQVPPLLSTVFDGFTGAKWCIAYQKTDQYWNSYTGRGDWFIFLLGEKVPTKKIAIQLSKDFLSQLKAVEYYESLFSRTYPKLERMLVNTIINSKDFLFLENDSLEDLITSEIDKCRAEFKSIVLNFHKLLTFYTRNYQLSKSSKRYAFNSTINFDIYNVSAWDSKDMNNRFNPFEDSESSPLFSMDKSSVSYCAKVIFNEILKDSTLLEKIEDVLANKFNIKNDTVYSLKESVMNQLSIVVNYFSSECLKNILWELYGSNIQDNIIEDFKKALDSFTIYGTNTIDFEKIYNFVGVLGDDAYYYSKKTPQNVDFISLLSALCTIILTKKKTAGYATFKDFYEGYNSSDKNKVELLLMDYLKNSDMDNPSNLAKEKSSDINIIDLILEAIIDPATHKFTYDFSQFEGNFRLDNDNPLSSKNSSNKKYLLSSLEGCPKVCSSFFLRGFTLESGNLVGAPVEVGAYFKVVEAGITSLKGAPLKVAGIFDVIPEEGVTFNMNDLKGITSYGKTPLLEADFPYSSVDLDVTSKIAEFGVLNIPNNVPVRGNGVITNVYYYGSDEIVPAYKTLSLNYYTGSVTQRTSNLINKIGNNYEALLITIQSLSKSSTSSSKMSANDFFNILGWEKFSQESKPFITESIWSLPQLKDSLEILPESLPIKVYVSNKYTEKTLASLKKQFDIWCKAHPNYTAKFGNIEVIPKRLLP